MTSPSDLIAGARFRSDLQDTNRVLQAEWITLVNEALDSTWNMCAAARPDFQVAPPSDFAVASGFAAKFTVPAAFHSLIDVVYAPDTSQEYSLGPFNWQNRRSPGGWIWPVGYSGSQGASAARLMGWEVFLEPSLNAGGTYRCWFCPKPHLVVQTVRLATVAALPACVAAGAGVGKTLTATVVGALSVDGQAVVVNDKLLVKNQVATADNGVYVVTRPGDGGTTFQLTRAPGYDTAAVNAGVGGEAIGDIVGVGQSDAALNVGTQEGKFFTLTTFTAIEVAQVWTEGASIDAVLDRFVEVPKLKMTIAALQRDNRSGTAGPFAATLMGNDGKSGLQGEMKSYFATTRAPGPQKMVDTDMQHFRGFGWNGGGW